jgi:hypothetical protein
MTAGAGHLWVAEHVAGTATSRVDEFDGESGVFMKQLNEAEGLASFTHGVAVGDRQGKEEEVYVGANDEGAAAVGAYAASGNLQAVWTGQATPAKTFGVEVNAVAYDESSNQLEDWAAGDLYVAAAGSATTNVVDVLRPGVEGKEPEKAEAVITGTCKATGEACPSEPVPFTEPSEVAVSALDGAVYVADAHRRIDIFKPAMVAGDYEFKAVLSGPPAAAFHEIAAIAVDSGTGDLYVVDAEGVDEFSAGGAFMGRLSGSGTEQFSNLRSVAVDTQSHHVYVGDARSVTEGGFVDVFGPNLVVPDVRTSAANSVAATSAVVTGTVNPDGAGEAMCAFAFGTTRSLGTEASCEPATVSGGETQVHSTLRNLQPDTSYFYKLTASNGNGVNHGELATTECEGAASEVGCFTTLGPGILSESASSATATAITLEAILDPHGQKTSYYFEYGPSEAYGSLFPTAPGAQIGAFHAEVPVAQRVQGLNASTTYHYRVAVVNEVAPGSVETFYGKDETFSTSSPTSEFVLPDGRQWELVSPPDKRGAQLLGIGRHIVQAAASGRAVTSMLTAPTEEQPAGYANFVQMLSVRKPSGWETRDLTSPYTEAIGIEGSAYHMFNQELGEAVFQPPGAFVPGLSAAASEQTAYLRANLTAESAFCTSGCFEPLATGCPQEAGPCAPAVQAHANVPAGTHFGEEGTCPPAAGSVQKNDKCGPQAVLTTPDLRHIVLTSTAALTADAKDGGLFEWSANHLGLVSRLPCAPQPCNGEPATNRVAVGYEGVVDRHAISTDGSRVVWSEKDGGLYLRDMQEEETVRLDQVSGGSGEGTPEPRYQDAAADGSKIYFTDNQRLTPDAGGLGTSVQEGDLYQCLVVAERGNLHCDLSDITPRTPSGESARVLNLVTGESEDGSWVYFVADGALAPGAVKGTCSSEILDVRPASEVCNLYVWHAGVTKLVSVLSANDEPDWNGQASKFGLGNLSARVSPDGRWLAFVSQRSLTGYDTRDAKTGLRDEEVYLYNAGSESVVCASCNPAGTRPHGVRYGDMNNPDLLGTSLWLPPQGLAGALPSWTSYEGGGQSQYQSRYLADTGRLFFDSADGLVAADGNGTEDVYQYEPAGVGRCSATVSSGSDVYVPERGGCVGLISSGADSEESGFLDASATGGRDSEGHEGGGDVFFLTAGKLSSQDTDASLDVYDAHECTGTAPCVPPPSGAVPPCASENACKAASQPQPEIFGPPASGSPGAGNLATPPLPHPSSKPLSRAQKLARALKACKRKKSAKRRRACMRAARHRYGPHKSAKNSPTKGRK